MSWSLEFKAEKESVVEVVTNKVDEYRKDIVESQWQPTVEVNEHLDAAVFAAISLAKSIGQPGNVLHFMLSGHANPLHGPQQGYSDETVTVSVRVIAYEGAS